MKMKYVWDEWNGEVLPDNLHCVMLRNGVITYEEARVECGGQWDYSIDGSGGDIMSYCIAVPDESGEDYE